MEYGKLSLQNFKRFERALNAPRFQRALQTRIKRATLAAGNQAAREIRRFIAKGVPPPNRPLTKRIKHGSKPLAGTTGELYKSIVSVQRSWNEAFVGVLRTSRKYNIAQLMERGAVIPMTARMYGLFWVLWQNTLRDRGVRHMAPPLRGRAAELWRKNKKWHHPPTNSIIRIPKRPFATPVMKSKQVREMAVAHWREAIWQTIQFVTKR